MTDQITGQSPCLGKNRVTPPPLPKKHIGDIILSTAQRLASEYYRVQGENLPGGTMVGCMRWKAYGQSSTTVQLEVSSTDANYIGMYRCGSNKCPRCSNALVARNRSWIRAELLPALDARGLKRSMITLTISHGIDEDWVLVVDDLHEAFKRWDKRMKKIYRKLGYVGKLKSLEVTIGFNGIHPHFHILLPHSELPADELDALKEKMRAAWTKAVAESGRVVNEHGFDFKENAGEDYVAKLELAHEMASSTKTARRKGKTPQQLLIAAAKGDTVAGLWWQKLTVALGNRSRFHAGDIASKLGIKTPTEWDDIPTYASQEIEADIDADIPDEDWMIDYVGPEVEPEPPPLIVEYSHEDHMRATTPALGRPGIAMIKRAARRGGQLGVDKMVGALVREYYAKVKKAPFWDVGDTALVDLYPDIIERAAAGPLTPDEVTAYLAVRRLRPGEGADAEPDLVFPF